MLEFWLQTPSTYQKNMSFTGLLERGAIDAAIRSFSKDAEVACTESDEGSAVYVVTLPELAPAMIKLHFRGDSQTTIQDSQGKNRELSAKIAAHIVGTCSKRKFEQRPLSIANISQEDFDWLLQHLEQDHKFKITKGSVAEGVRYDIEKTAKDYVNLNRYNTGKLLMQGKALEVYSVVALVLMDLVPDKAAVLKSQLLSYDLGDIEPDALVEEAEQHLPTGYKILGETLMCMMASALAMSKIAIKLPDFSLISYPALRALEGYMKALFRKHGYNVKNQQGLGDYFNDAVLKGEVAKKIGCLHTASAIEKSYSLYRANRHGLFHTESNPDASRIIETREEAVMIVHSVIKTIEDTAQLIPA